MNDNCVTLAGIEAKIAAETYHYLSDGRTTICELTMANGYTVTGESACVAPENFDAAVGRKYAREKAVDNVWPLEGYLLRERLYGTK